MSNGNFLVDNFEADMDFHYPKKHSCFFCEDTHEINDVGLWISIVRELKSVGENNYNFKRCLKECHKILVEGKTDCPSCRRSK